MEEQKHSADLYEIASKQLNIEATRVQDFFGELKKDFQDEFAQVGVIWDSVTKV